MLVLAGKSSFFLCEMHMENFSYRRLLCQSLCHTFTCGACSEANFNHIRFLQVLQYQSQQSYQNKVVPSAAVLFVYVERAHGLSVRKRALFFKTDAFSSDMREFALVY